MAKVLVSLDDVLLRRVDRIAQSRGLTRSAYFAQLVERDAAQLDGRGSTRAAQRSLAKLDELFGPTPAGESTAALRSERDAR